MNNDIKLKPGDKVTYIHHNGKKEHGIVKREGPNANGVFVVFNWNNQPKNFKNYTASLCFKKHLKKGWL